MSKKPVTTKSRSNAANGTKQVWIRGTLHKLLSRKADTDYRQIRTTVELLLLSALGYEGIEQAEAELSRLEAQDKT